MDICDKPERYDFKGLSRPNFLKNLIGISNLQSELSFDALQIFVMQLACGGDMFYPAFANTAHGTLRTTQHENWFTGMVVY